MCSDEKQVFVSGEEKNKLVSLNAINYIKLIKKLTGKNFLESRVLFACLLWFLDWELLWIIDKIP